MKRPVHAGALGLIWFLKLATHMLLLGKKDFNSADHAWLDLELRNANFNARFLMRFPGSCRPSPPLVHGKKTRLVGKIFLFGDKKRKIRLFNSSIKNGFGLTTGAS